MKLIEWYERNKRDLPWRNTTDPYRIWLSEIILQQTRVVQGMPYYLKFIEHFPTVSALAEADEQVVLRLWQGLGYYSRARNLHKCAKVLMQEYNGDFPKKVDELLKLPGVGRYTAAAIASFSFGVRSAVVDGNVMRVLSRVFGLEYDISNTKEAAKFFELAGQLISIENPATHNQAIMEFGAIQCTPKSPDCEACIFKPNCVAYNKGLQESLPVKTKKIKVRKRYFHYLVVQKEGKLLMRERRSKDIWTGLYDFFLVESTDVLNEDKILVHESLTNTFGDKIKISGQSEEYTHILTHQKIFARFYMCVLEENQASQAEIFHSDFGFYDPDEIMALPKPVLISNYLRDYIF
ncbi:MAG: A/G-specific adenine glycosylase [Bacteroidota bacterium]